MLWILYNTLFPIGFLLLLPRFLVRMVRRGGYARRFIERFGFYNAGTRTKMIQGGRLWIHAVSVGEIFVALRFIEEYRNLHPDAQFVLSTTTSTGRKIAEENIKEEDVLIYFPLDFPFVMRRVLEIIHPRMLILVECELWPNLIRLAKRRGIPVALINGRISEHSYRGYRKLRLFTRPLLAQADLLCVQSKREKEMLVDLGADEKRLHILSSAKYDITPLGNDGEEKALEILRQAGVKDGEPVLLGGSTWPGEEAALLDFYKENRGRFPGLRLVLVPRHFERSDEVQREIESHGFAALRRSRLPEGTASPDSVLLVDTTGELRCFYAVATVIFVGKSLTDHGGQNIIEPAQCGKPIVVGPHMENFPVIIRDFLAAEAIVQVRDARDFVSEVSRLLADPQARASLGERAQRLVLEKSGAIKKTIALVDKLLS